MAAHLIFAVMDDGKNSSVRPGMAAHLIFAIMDERKNKNITAHPRRVCRRGGAGIPARTCGAAARPDRRARAARPGAGRLAVSTADRRRRPRRAGAWAAVSSSMG